MTKRLILVPIDFLQPTLDALEYARKFASKNHFDLYLLHIAGSKNEVQTGIQKMKDLIGSLNENTIDIQFNVIQGTIKKDIGKIAQSIDALFIIMGIHGVRGVQKITGGRSLKVVTDSKVPFIVLQADTNYRDIKKIAMTIDLERESVQIVKVAFELAKNFDSEVVMIGGDHDDPALLRKVMVNVNVAKKYFKENGVNSHLELLPRKSFEKKLIEYCGANGVDMIAATYYPDTFYVLSTKFIENLFENDMKIPVLTLDSASINAGFQFSF
ncbi:MAG: universal stress protein [Fluviicola sp.]|nr:universal stress protein [Fluviicola sp.]